MSSTPQTGGFNVQVMPQVQLADPRLFDPYSRMSQGFGQGLDFSGKLQDIQLRRLQDERAAKQLEMQQAMQAAQMEGIDYSRTLRPLQRTALENEAMLSTYNRQLADITQPGKILKGKEPVVMESNTFEDYDENGNLAQYRREKKVNPVTGEEIYAPRIYEKTLKTKKELEQIAEQSKAMSMYRANMGQAALNRSVTAAQIAQFKQANPQVKTKTFYSPEGFAFEQIINHDGTLGEIFQVTNGDGTPMKYQKQESAYDAIMRAAGAQNGGQPGAAAPSQASNPILDIATRAASSGDTLHQGNNIVKLAPHIPNQQLPRPSSPEHSQALLWLKQNPNDPRANAVRARLGLPQI